MLTSTRLELDSCWSRGKGKRRMLKKSRTWSCRRSLHTQNLQVEADTVVQSCNLGTLSQSHQASVSYIDITVVCFFFPSPPFS